MKKLLLTIAIALVGQMASADNSSPAWVCSMNFKGEAKGLQLIVGKTYFSGKGTIRCLGITGETAEIPVKITMKSRLLSPTVAIEKMKLYGEALNVSLFNTDPEAMLGEYYVGHAEGSALIGAGVLAAVKKSFPELNFRIGVEFAKGLGLHVGFQKMLIERDENR